jgi:hypothetical protein
MLAIPEIREQFVALPPEARAAVIAMFQAASRTYRANADVALRKHKPPMYSYWQGLAVNARHLALAGRKSVAICGRVSNGSACTMAAGSKCPDCGLALHDFPEGS